jgi:hypothetical protein
MRRVAAIVGICVALVASSATPAFAQWEWFKWIQELSGPGPFVARYAVTPTFGCKMTRLLAGQTQDQVNAEVASAFRLPRLAFCDTLDYNWRNVRFFGAATVTFLDGEGHNNLDFAPALERHDKVKARLFMGRFVVRLHELLDAGVGAGVMQFVATPTVTLNRTVIDPFVAIRPGAILLFIGGNAARPAGDIPRWIDYLARSVHFTVGGTFYPQGFTVEDFGAFGIVGRTGSHLRGTPELIGHWGARITIPLPRVGIATR